jgi:hypothetical protein
MTINHIKQKWHPNVDLLLPIFHQRAFLTEPYLVRLPSAAFLRSEGKCPLAPEEAVLMLAAIGFKRSTNIYIAGAEIYGVKDRMAAISRLYPALVTKETLLSPSELEPFRNLSSQVNFREISHVISSCIEKI